MSEEATKTGNASAGSPSAGIEGLLSNPELLRTLGTLIGNLSKPQNTDPGEQSIAASAVASPAAKNTDGLSALLSNPDLLEKLPGMIATLGPLMGNLQTAPPKEAVTSGHSPLHDHREGCRDQLLLSLKPFLSQSRCDAIDTMLRIAKLSHVLGQLK